jgi:DNA-binding response OmpR family regulator
MDALSNKKILVVDDEKPLAKALELKLSHAGFDVKTAFDGREAIDAIKNNHFDLILLDLVMPKLDGFGVMLEMKQNNIQIPIIVTSNLSQKGDNDKAKELGAIEYFVKSNTPLSDIVNYIKTALIK